MPAITFICLSLYFDLFYTVKKGSKAEFTLVFLVTNHDFVPWFPGFLSQQLPYLFPLGSLL
jgi:hypothetical protein